MVKSQEKARDVTQEDPPRTLWPGQPSLALRTLPGPSLCSRVGVRDPGPWPQPQGRGHTPETARGSEHPTPRNVSIAGGAWPRGLQHCVPLPSLPQALLPLFTGTGTPFSAPHWGSWPPRVSQRLLGPWPHSSLRAAALLSESHLLRAVIHIATST